MRSQPTPAQSHKTRQPPNPSPTSKTDPRAAIKTPGIEIDADAAEPVRHEHIPRRSDDN